MIVAIDGPAGSGKSTLARRLALELGLPYVNTGSTYRAVAREALRRGVDPDDGPALGRIATELRFDLDREAVPPSLLVEGAPPGDDLLTPEVEAAVSRVSSHPEVRAALREVQRRLGSVGAVVEGRDIGRVVFPDADVKIFLGADPGERAARRLRERGSEDPALAEALGRRDAMDSRVNPLVAADDAVDVDTTGRTIDEIVEELVAVVRRAGGPR
ncbi:MAG TPA: (d)CMP kinase [Actinomycetota bacterium]